MKRICIFLTLALALFASVRAEEPLRLVVKTLQGQEQSLTATGLSATIADGTLTLSNGAETASFPVAQLDKMYFKGGSLSVGEISMDSPVEVFTLTGVSLGSYPTLSEAASTLPGGIYVFKSADTTFKMQLK